MEWPLITNADIQAKCFGVCRTLTRNVQLMGIALLVVVLYHTTSVLSQDNNDTTTEMGEFNIYAGTGTTQSPPYSSALALTNPQPLITNRPTPPQLNRTMFNLAFDIFKLTAGAEHFSLPADECLLRQDAEKSLLDFNLDTGGRLCPSYYDLIQCWPASEPGVHVRPCPALLNSVKYDSSDNVSRLCLFNGTWGFNGKSDYTRCQPLKNNENPHEFPIMVITLSGYSLSFAALVGAFIIFLYFKSLRCVRNYIHWNLVSSFILLYISFFVALISNPYVLNPNKYWVCRMLVTVLNYCLMTNFFWMFVEGVYLYTLVARAFSVRKDRFWVYCILGWVVPIFFVILYAILKKFYDTECWLNDNEHSSRFAYIISAPIIFIILINLIFLIHIMCILVTKLRASHSLETQQYRKAVKGTFVLMPLLGVTYLIFIFKPQTDKESVSYLVFHYLNAILHSTQGFFVAIIYVYMNQEVRNVVRRKFKRWREENTLPTKPVSRRGSNSRNNSLANIFNSRRGSHSTEEPSTLPFRIPGSGKPPTTNYYANGTRVPPFVRLDEIQPLNSPTHPSGSSPKTPPHSGIGLPSYNDLLFPVPEVDETIDASEETDQGDAEDNQPLKEENNPVVELQPEKNEDDVLLSDEVSHNNAHNELTNGTLEGDSVAVVNREINKDIPCSAKSDKNENNKHRTPLNHLLPTTEQVAIAVGQTNENNNNNGRRQLPTSHKTGPRKKVSFEDDNAHRFLTRPGPNLSALNYSEVTQSGQSLRHDDVTDTKEKHPSRDECDEKVSNSKLQLCILPDVRQKNSGVVNGSIIFPKAPPGTPV